MNCEHCNAAPSDFGMRKFGHVTVAGRRMRLCPACMRSQKRYAKLRQEKRRATAHRRLD